MEKDNLIKMVDDLVRHNSECEWIEFKHNFHSPEEIGENISALSNSACLNNKPYGYLVYGVDDKNHSILGTTFKAKDYKKGNENLESWISTRLDPRIDFSVFEFDYAPKKHISIYIIPAAKNRPVEFLHVSYIRIGSITRKLGDYPEKESKIWRKDSVIFENERSKSNVSATEVIKLLNTQAYFDLLKLPYPSTQKGVIEKFVTEGLLFKEKTGYCISKLGALLFAKNLGEFDLLDRKSVRVIVYKGKNKIETVREHIEQRGYAIGFVSLIEWINSQLPANEEIGKALRNDKRMYPEVAIRELLANALIHQDFSEKGFPMVEIYSDRIEISNPGIPLINPQRFIDEYVSRNEKLAGMMRRMGFCEEKGSGLDKVIFFNELYQLPGINVLIGEKRTRVVMYSYMALNNLDKKDKVRACYQHACLKYVSNDKMTNQSLRDRFKIEDRNYSIASRIIRDTIADGLIKEDNPESKSRKFAGYIPFWA